MSKEKKELQGLFIYYQADLKTIYEQLALVRAYQIAEAHLVAETKEENITDFDQAKRHESSLRRFEKEAGAAHYPFDPNKMKSYERKMESLLREYLLMREGDKKEFDRLHEKLAELLCFFQDPSHRDRPIRFATARILWETLLEGMEEELGGSGEALGGGTKGRP